MSAAVLGSTCAPSAAADLGPVYGKRHVRTGWHGYNLRDRCAYAGYHCLYAYDGYVYHYPFDDRPSAYAYRWAPTPPSVLRQIVIGTRTDVGVTCAPTFLIFRKYWKIPQTV